MLFNFDFDGVIVDSFDQLLDLGIQASEAYPDCRAPVADDVRRIENLTFDDVARCIGLPEDQVASYSARVFQLQKEQWDVEVFPDIVPVFHQLAASHTLVVVTASQSEAVAGTLADYGIGDCVSAVLGGELGTSKAERIKQAMETYGFTSKDTFMVGDAISDVRQGKAAGVKTIAVTWGFQDRDLLAKESPDMMIDAPKDLLNAESTCK